MDGCNITISGEMHGQTRKNCTAGAWERDSLHRGAQGGGENGSCRLEIVGDFLQASTIYYQFANQENLDPPRNSDPSSNGSSVVDAVGESMFVHSRKMTV